MTSCLGSVGDYCAPHPAERCRREAAGSDAFCLVLTPGIGEAVGSSEMYSSATPMEQGHASVKADAPTAPTKRPDR